MELLEKCYYGGHLEAIIDGSLMIVCIIYLTMWEVDAFFGRILGSMVSPHITNGVVKLVERVWREIL